VSNFFPVGRTAEDVPSQPFTQSDMLILLDFLRSLRDAFWAVFSRSVISR
jgi:hypothetical protein